MVSPSTLTVAGTIQSTGLKLTTSPSAGYILTSDASGVGTWQAAASGGGSSGLFGDGSDGNRTLDGSTAILGMVPSGNIYTATRDLYFDNLTINTGITLKPSGYRIFVRGTLTVNGKIDGDGDAGNNGNNGPGGWTVNPGGAGVTMPDGYLKGSVLTGSGGNGGLGDHGSGGIDGSPGLNGTNTANSLGSNAGGTAGAGGYGGILVGNPSHGHPGAAGTGGTVTGPNVALIADWHLVTLLDISTTGSTVKFDNSASAPGGGGGAGGTAGSGQGNGGGSGGAGGCSGRIVAIYAKNIIISATGSISANGGKGGNGGDGGGAGAQQWTAGGGGGAGGGNGGVIICVYNTLSNSGSITVNAGAGGTKGLKGVCSGCSGDNATNGNDGTAGVPGTIRLFQR
jgi:hypothetical protein